MMLLYYVGGANSLLRTQAPARSDEGTVTLTWSSVEGGSYQVEASGNLADNSWVVIATSIPAAAREGQTSIDDPDASVAASNRFYRVSRTTLAPYSP